MKASRIRLGLLAFLSIVAVLAHNASAETVTLTFQDGDGGAYSTTQGATIAPYFGVPGSGTGDGSGGTLVVSIDMVVSDFTPGKTSFVRFPNIIGDNVGQIPPGSTIESASLQLMRVNSSSHGAAVRSVLSAWDENTITGQNFPSASESVVGSLPAGGAGPSVADVTATVQTWASGAANWGVKLSYGYSQTTFSETFHSDDATNVADRPLLSVTFTTPTPVEPSTWGRVKALYR